MAAVFAFVADIHRLEPSPSDAAYLLRAFDRADHVTGVLNREAGKLGLITSAELESSAGMRLDDAELAALLGEALAPSQVRKLAQARHAARKQKDWKTADAIRDHLKKCGVQFEDIADGVRYKLP
jgi:cysteinyl-tRNA synthetase